MKNQAPVETIQSLHLRLRWHHAREGKELWEPEDQHTCREKGSSTPDRKAVYSWNANTIVTYTRPAQWQHKLTSQYGWGESHRVSSLNKELQTIKETWKGENQSSLVTKPLICSPILIDQSWTHTHTKKHSEAYRHRYTDTYTHTNKHKHTVIQTHIQINTNTHCHIYTHE